MIFGISITTWIALTPRIVALVKFFAAVVIGYSVINQVDPLTAAIQLLEKMASVIPQPKKFSEWTAEETAAWYSGADGSSMGNNAP